MHVHRLPDPPLRRRAVAASPLPAAASARPACSPFRAHAEAINQDVLVVHERPTVALQPAVRVCPPAEGRARHGARQSLDATGEVGWYLLALTISFPPFIAATVGTGLK